MRPFATSLPCASIGHAVAQRLGVREHVGAEEHGASAIAQRHDQIAHFTAAKRVEARHRLVEKDDLRVVDQRLCDADSLNHSFRELSQRKPPFVARCRPDRAAPTRAGAVPRGRSRTTRRNSRAAPRRSDSRRSTGFPADSRCAASPKCRQPGDPGFRLTGGWIDQLHQQLEGGRLACAVRAEKPEGLALGDFKIQVVEGSIAPADAKIRSKSPSSAPLCGSRTCHAYYRPETRDAEQTSISGECCWNALLERRAVRRGAARGP